MRTDLKNFKAKVAKLLKVGTTRVRWTDLKEINKVENKLTNQLARKVVKEKKEFKILPKKTRMYKIVKFSIPNWCVKENSKQLKKQFKNSSTKIKIKKYNDYKAKRSRVLKAKRWLRKN